MINVGQFDMKDGVRQTIEWIKTIGLDDQFFVQPRKVYTYYDQNDSSTELIGGYYRHHDNFSLIIVPGAGHMVAASQPYLTMKFVMDYVNKGHLSCETESSGSCKSVASDMCDYMNDCYGQGTCNSDGKCECNSGFFGPDCSATAETVQSSSFTQTVTGRRWSYFIVPENQDAVNVSITSDRAVDIYITVGTTVLPDAVNFDGLLKAQTNIKLTHESLDISKGAIIALYCSGGSTTATTFTVAEDANDSILKFFQ